MSQLLGSSLRWNEVEPPSRPHSLWQAQDVLRDGVAPAKIIEKPSIDPGGTQIALNSLNICAHWGFSSIVRARFNCHASSVLHQQRKDLLSGHTADFDAFRAASFTTQNSNSRSGCFQKLRQEFHQRLVRPAFNRWPLQPLL